MSVLSKRTGDNFVILSMNFEPNNTNKRGQKVSVKYSDFIFIFLINSGTKFRLNRFKRDKKVKGKKKQLSWGRGECNGKVVSSTIQTRHYLGKKPWTSHPTNYKLNRITQILSQNIYNIYHMAKHLFSETLFRQETSDKSSVLGQETIDVDTQ